MSDTPSSELVERLKLMQDECEAARIGYTKSLPPLVANTLKGSEDALRLAAAEIDRLRDSLERYGEHETECDLHYWESGEQRDDGYYNKYRGKWYRYPDQAPPCSCGLHTALARKDEITDSHVRIGELGQQLAAAEADKDVLRHALDRLHRAAAEQQYTIGSKGWNVGTPEQGGKWSKAGAQWHQYQEVEGAVLDASKVLEQIHAGDATRLLIKRMQEAEARAVKAERERDDAQELANGRHAELEHARQERDDALRKLGELEGRLPKDADGKPLAAGDIINFPDGTFALIPGVMGNGPVHVLGVGVRKGAMRPVGEGKAAAAMTKCAQCERLFHPSETEAENRSFCCVACEHGY